MRHAARLLTAMMIWGGILFSGSEGTPAETKGGYVLPGDVKEGWKVFTLKKCNLCHSILGEGGKGGPDLGTAPGSFVSPAQVTALLWNHGPEMWTRMSAKKVPLPGMTTKEMTDLFGFLYFLRYMEEPGDPTRGRSLLEAGACGKCHRVKGAQKDDLSRWGMYINPLLWAQMMWNHALPMEQEMREKGVPRIQFKGKDMADLIAYIRSASEGVERVYLSPGDPRSGENLFGKKGCSLCHGAGGPLDLARKKHFPGTPAELAGAMWNHSHLMQKAAMEKGLPRLDLSSDEMTDLVAYLFSIRYFDGPGDPVSGKRVFAKKNCGHCHGKDTKKPDLSALKGRVSPIVMARALWNHGPMMLERSWKAKLSWQKMDDKEMVDLMEYLNQGTP